MSARPIDAATLLDLLEERADNPAENTGFRFILDGDLPGRIDELSIPNLSDRAQAIAGAIQDAHGEGERVLLFYPPGLDFIGAFFGAICAGAVAVPAYPGRMARMLPRLLGIIADCQPRVVLTTRAILSMAGSLLDATPELRSLHWIATDDLEAGTAAAWRRPAIRGKDLAFLQYTSGSTGSPKGVMVTHENVLHNSEMIRRAGRHTRDSVGVNWLPAYHDMGLIGSILQPLYVGFPSVLMSPVDFLRRPFRWLHAISRFRGTSNAAPNFAFDLCVRRVPEEQKRDLDLSCWEVVFDGAEPVRKETIERFTAAFASCGFRRESIYPCYGLAESTLFVTGASKVRAPHTEEVDARALAEGRATVKSAPEGASVALTSVGHAWPGQEVAVVDFTTHRRLPDGLVGEIWVRGRSVAAGYWNRPEETQQTFAAHLADNNADTREGPFLRTGDLGFMRDGELFVTGRLKDVIIIRGQNHYPQDIERSVEEAHPAVRPGSCAAFPCDRDGEEGLVVVAEIARAHPPALLEEVVRAITGAVAERNEVQIRAGALWPPGSVHKTSSGKLQRSACKAAFLAGTVSPLRSFEIGVEVDATARSRPIYRDLTAACARIDRRNTRYRFDLERDVRWDLLDAPGLYLGPRFLAESGMIDIDALRDHEEAHSLFQWAFAVATCEAFIALEEALLQFTADSRPALTPTRSLVLLEEEEHKHIQLFRRYADHLYAERPELKGRFRRSLDLTDGFRHDAAPAHYLAWLNILLFEEYTVFLDVEHREALDVQMQPAWQTAHSAHRREEIQHVVTDVACLNALELSDDERRLWSWAALERAPDLLDHMWPVESAFALYRERYPELATMHPLSRNEDLPLLRARALHRLLREPNGFDQTLRAAPALALFADAESLGPDWLNDLRHAASPRADAGAPTAQQLRTAIDAWYGQTFKVKGSLDVDRTFADLGVDSLAAAELVATLEHELGRVLSPSITAHCPTPRALIEVLLREESTPSRPSRTVLLQPEGSAPPFFCVHPAGGTVSGYTDLAQSLRGLCGRPFYGLAAQGLADDAPIHQTVESMAETYVQDLRAIDPHGPYCLGGWSFGGVVAYAMAQRLIGQGAEVSSLVLLDTPTPAAVAHLVYEDDFALISYLAAREGVHLSPEELRAGGERRALEIFAEVSTQGRYVPAGASERYLRRMLAIFHANLGALHAYRPEPYPGAVTLLRAIDQDEPAWIELAGHDPSYGWSRYAGELRVEEIPGSHFSLIKPPNTRGVGAVLARVLDRS